MNRKWWLIEFWRGFGKRNTAIDLREKDCWLMRIIVTGIYELEGIFNNLLKYSTMKTNLLKLAIILVVIFSGCKKHESNQQTFIPPPNSYIKSISVYDTTGVLRIIQSLEYDTLHRLKKLTDLELGTNPDSILLTFTFNYSAVRVFIKETISTGPNYSFTLTYYLNSSGLPDSSIYVSLASPTDSTYQRYTYTYNSDGQLATRGVKNADSITGTFIYHYLNRNVDYSTVVPANQNSKTTYFYSMEHFNTIGNENAGLGFLGKSCFCVFKIAPNADMHP